MKKLTALLMSFILFVNMFGFYTAFAHEKSTDCVGINKLSMRNEDFYNGYSSAKLLAKNRNTSINQEVSLFMLGGIDIKSGKTTEIADETVTGTGVGRQLVTKEMLYLPFGSAFVFDYADVHDANGEAITQLSMRMYEYDENGNYLGEVNAAYLSPENNVDGDATNKSFVVTKEEGMYVQLRFIPWSMTFDKGTVVDFNERLKVYDLTSISAPVFENSTITKCWENEDSYEAWATKTIFYNKTDDMYYWFYVSQPSHTDYDGCIRVRTSADLENWSSSRVIYDTETAGSKLSMDAAMQTQNGDFLISMMFKTNDEDLLSTCLLRSSDNGETWQKQDLILDGKNVTGVYRIQRPRILDDGRIFTCLFAQARKENFSIAYSEDNGKTFVSADFASSFPLKDNGEYDFVKLKNGNILCVERAGGVCACISVDNGKSFICEKSLKNIDRNTQMSNAPFIIYDKATDHLVIYEIDRFRSGALVGIYTTGEKISDYLLNDSAFSGFIVNSCYLGLNGNADQGYPHLIKTKDGGYKCFYYYPSGDGKNTASFYSVESISYESRQHSLSWTNKNGLPIKSCDKCGEISVQLPFTDVGSYASYNDYLAYTSVYNQFIAGTNPKEYTLFSPTTPITRAMFVAILYRMAGNPYENGNNPHSSNPFSDVGESTYYYNAACWALDEGITNQTTFKPNDNVTREQTARFLFAYAEANHMLGNAAYKNVNLNDYPDYDAVHSWAIEPLQWANYNDMITGTSQGYINPQGATQRIHAARILYGFGAACNIGNFS